MLLFINVVVYQCCLQVLLFTSDVFFTDDLYVVIPHYMISEYSFREQTMIVSPCGRKVQSTVN